MYIGYQFYSEESESVDFSVSQLLDVSYERKEGICYVAIGGTEADILFSMTPLDYNTFITSLKKGMPNNYAEVRSSHVGIAEDYDYTEEDWESHLVNLKAKFERLERY